MYFFEKTTTSYAIEIDENKFLSLMDSESYATDNAAYESGQSTLGEKLDKLDGISAVEYNGHFGSSVFLTIDTENDHIETHIAISKIIDEHLEWCSTLELTVSVKARRAREAI